MSLLRITDRYIFREVITVWLMVTFVLLFFLFSNVVARLLASAAANNFARESLGILLGLTSISFLTTLIPFALFLAMMLALGRMYQDSEMPAYQACGIGPKRLYRPLFMVALPVTALLTWLSVDLDPWAANQRFKLERADQAVLAFGNLEAGRFRTMGTGNTVFYAERVDQDGQLHNIFIRREVGERQEIVVAERGFQRFDEQGSQSLILYNGRRYEGVPGEAAYRTIEFAEHGIPIDVPTPDLHSDDLELMATADLIGSSDMERQAELHWRLSQPVSVLVLTLLVVPLSRTDPRRGRYGKLVFAVLIYLVYANLMGAARIMMTQSTVPVWLGTWWVHGLLVLLTLTLFSQQRMRMLWAASKKLPAEKE
ncbi:MAG: LPS export ABC transporter permease LptF [Gammaproteobacteria bacterium]|nr:LPS export ABC transporter permease LptF [Gammaproteobacteria bacterium]